MANLDNEVNNMDSIEDIIENLTNNGEYGASLCLLLYMTNNTKSLYYLDYLNIKGKELESLDNLCKEESIDFIVQTIRFLRSGFLGKDEIKQNLNNKTPIQFIPRLLMKSENWENAYEDFAFEFRKQLQNTKRKSC